MTNHINVTIESSTRFRSNSAGSEQKEFEQYQGYRVLFVQVLKAMVILASLVGAGVAIGCLLRMFGDEFGGRAMDSSNFLIQTPLNSFNGMYREAKVQNAETLPLFTLPTQAVPKIVAYKLSVLQIGRILGIALNPTGSLAFIADYDTGLNIIEVIDPLNPKRISTPLQTGGYSYGIVLNPTGTLAFITDQNTGLNIINISDPYNPIRIGFPFKTGGTGTIGIGTRGIVLNPTATLAFITDQTTGLNVINITNPLNPTQVGAPLSTGGYSQGIAISPDATLIYVVDLTTGLNIINISDPFHPTFMASPTLKVNSYGIVISPDSTLAFIADQSTGLNIINVSDPLHPARLSILSTGGGSLGIAIGSDARLAFVGDALTGLNIINISNPMLPTRIGYTLQIQQAEGIALNPTATLAYVADGLTGLNVIKLNVIRSSPTNHVVPISYYFQESGSIGPQGIALDPTDTLAYFANQNGFNILSVTNPSHPTLLSTLSKDIYFQGVVISPDATFAFTEGLGLNIINISSPIKPTILSNLPISSSFIAINPTGTIAFTTGITALNIINLSNPFQPTSVHNFFSLPNCIFLGFLNPSATLALIIDQTNSFKIINITDLSRPSSTDIPFSLTGSIFLGLVNPTSNLVFIASNEGVNIINITDLLNPALIGILPELSNVEGVTLSPDAGLIFVVDGNKGLNIIDITNPLVPTLKFRMESLAIKNGLANEFSGITLNTDGNLLYVIGTSGGNTNLNILDVGCFYVSVPTIFTSDFTNEKAILRVSEPIRGQILFFTNHGVSAAPNILNIFQINEQGERVNLPYWFSLSSIDYSISGFPPKDTSGQRLIIETQINTTTPNGPVTDYVWSYFYIEPSLIIDTTGTKIFIESPGSTASLVIQLSNPLAGQFVLQDFGAVKTSFDKKAGTLKALGVRSDINTELFQKLQFSVDDPAIINTSSVTLEVDDTINVPQTVSGVSLSKFTFHQPPALNPGILINQTGKSAIDPKDSFIFTIPENVFTPNPASLSLLYNVTGNPSWLSYNLITRQFSGTPTLSEMGKHYDIVISADDGYKSSSINWAFAIRDYAAPVFNPDSGFRNHTIQARHPFSYIIPTTTFQDPNGLPMQYSVEDLVLWTTFNPNFNTISGIAPNITGDTALMISVGNGYRISNVMWVITVRPNQSPMIELVLRDATATVNQPFVYPIANGFNSSNTLHYSSSVSSDPELSWLRIDPTQGILSGQPTESNLGNYPVMVIASDPYGGSANQTFTIRVIDPSAASAQRLAQLQEILKIVGYAVSAAGATFTLYKNKALIRNTWTGKSYTRPANLFNENGTYSVSIPSDEIKEVKVLERKSPQACAKKTAAALTHCLSHHLYGQVTFVQRQYEDWVKYDRRTNTIQLDIEKLPESGEWGIQLFNNDGYVLEEIALTFPWNQEIDIAESEELQASTSRRSLGDGVSPREGVEARLLQNEA